MSASAIRPHGSSEWRHGWPLVLCGAAGLTLSNLHAGTIGTLMQPLSDLYGWGRAEISASILMICICMLVVGPMVGMLIGRWGARPLVLAGIPLFCAALAGVGLTGPGVTGWYVAWLLVGLTYPLVTTTIWTLGVGQVFDKHRGLAFALVLSGIGLAGFITPLLAVALLPQVGWQGVFFALAAGGFAVTFPLAFFLFHPDRIARAKAGVAVDVAPQVDGYAMPRILRSARFWSLAAAMILLGTAVGSLMIHFQPIMRDAGLSAGEAAACAALLGPASIAGRVVGGYLLDRLPARFITAAFFAGPAVVCAMLLYHDGSWQMSVAAAVFLGLATGAEGDAMSFLGTRYFGLRRYAVFFPILIGLYSIAFGLSPVLAGAAYDALGSYTAVLQLLIGGLTISVLLVLTLGPPPSHFDD